MTLILDHFDREVASGWGDTDTGHTWQLAGGLVSERSVGAAGGGRVTLASAPGTIRAHRLLRPWRDAEVLAQVVPGQTAVGEGLIVALAFRRSPSDGTAFYRARLIFNTDGTLSMDVTRGTVQVGSRTATGLAYAPGARLWVRGRVDGHRVRARVWADGTTEPGTWAVDQTIATDTIAVGDLGIMVSGFANNTNASPWFEVRRFEATYRLLVDNRLNGTSGAQVTNASLAETAQAGIVTIAAPGTRATYDSTQNIRGFPAIRIDSGHHRAQTPRLRVNLPATGPWSARWYVWAPRLQDAGHGTGEVRSLAVLPTHAWTVHATASGNIGSRLQPPDLAAAPLGWTAESGSAVATGQWWRVEMAYTGTDLTTRVYPGNALTGARVHTWAALADPGRTLDVTGYRWRRRPTLYWGDQGAEVAALQTELIALGYDLGNGGADGDFGNITLAAVQGVQSTYGLSPVDGIPGPETRAAMDLALGAIPPPLWVSHLAVADGEWIGPAEPPLTSDIQTRELHVGFLPI